MTQARVRSACPRRSDVNVCLCARVFVRSEGFGLSSLLRRRCREESGLPLPIQPEMRARDLPPCVHVLRCSLRRLGAGRGACKARACNISLENGLNSRRFIIHTQIDFGDIFTQLYVTHTHMCTLCIVYCVLCAVPARARAADPDSWTRSLRFSSQVGQYWHCFGTKVTMPSAKCRARFPGRT